MNINLDRVSANYRGKASLPPKRESKFYSLTEDCVTRELVLLRDSKYGETVVGVFKPTENRFSTGNVNGQRADLKFDKFSVNIHIEESNA